jgi:hypothetical protein
MLGNDVDHGLRKRILHRAHDLDGEVAGIFDQAIGRLRHGINSFSAAAMLRCDQASCKAAGYLAFYATIMIMQQSGSHGRMRLLLRQSRPLCEPVGQAS